MKKHGYFAGIDSGSATTDVVILDQDRTIVAKVILPTGAGASNGAQRALDQALQQAGLTQADLTATVTTGYGRGVIQTGDKSVTEITCHAKGATFSTPRCAPSSTSAARTARSSASSPTAAWPTSS